MQFQHRKYSRFSYRASNFYSNMVSAYRKIAGYLWSKKSADITVLPSVEHLLDDIAARYESIVKDSLRSSNIALKNASIDIQRLKLQSMDTDIFLGCIHLLSSEDAQVEYWLQKIPELEKKIHKRLRADGLFGHCSFTGLWWVGSRDKPALVCLQANQSSQAV
jgi:hypothetical protein